MSPRTNFGVFQLGRDQGISFARSRAAARVTVEREIIIDVPVSTLYLLVIDEGSYQGPFADWFDPDHGLPVEEIRPNSYNMGFFDPESLAYYWRALPQQRDAYTFDLAALQAALSDWRRRHAEQFPDEPGFGAPVSAFLNLDISAPTGYGDHSWYAATIPDAIGNPLGSVENTRFYDATQAERNGDAWIASILPLVRPAPVGYRAIVLFLSRISEFFHPANLGQMSRLNEAIRTQIESRGGRADYPSLGLIPPPPAYVTPSGRVEEINPFGRWLWIFAKWIELL